MTEARDVSVDPEATGTGRVGDVDFSIGEFGLKLTQ